MQTPQGGTAIAVRARSDDALVVTIVADRCNSIKRSPLDWTDCLESGHVERCGDDTMTSPPAHAWDDLDVRLVGLLRSTPGLPVVEMARRLSVARGTVQSRLDRLTGDGLITGFGPDVDAAAAGYGVLAFTTLEIAQGSDRQILDGLGAIDEVLEVHSITGPGDLHLRVVARSNEHLYEVLQRILELPGITRTQTQLALHTVLDRTVADLVATLA
jgi:DNA-binding Lrp family transcriptional regulator